MNTIKEDNITAMDVVDTVRSQLTQIAGTIDAHRRGDLTESILPNILKLRVTLDSYDNSVKRNAIAVDNLTQEKAGDKDLQKVASSYSMTMNQVVAYMDMCEQVNSSMAGTGIIAVPFWFYEQYLALKDQNKYLIEQTDNLMDTLSRVESKAKESELESLGIELPKRTNILTNSTTPYIAGETGPRFGDEHLDNEHTYIDPKLGRKV